MTQPIFRLANSSRQDALQTPRLRNSYARRRRHSSDNSRHIVALCDVVSASTREHLRWHLARSRSLSTSVGLSCADRQGWSWTMSASRRHSNVRRTCSDKPRTFPTERRGGTQRKRTFVLTSCPSSLYFRLSSCVRFFLIDPADLYTSERYSTIDVGTIQRWGN